MVFTLLPLPLIRTFRTPYIFVLACPFCLPLHISATEYAAHPVVETFPELTVTDTRLHTDYRWLADSLGHRMAELNRLPRRRAPQWMGRESCVRVTLGAEGQLRRSSFRIARATTPWTRPRRKPCGWHARSHYNTRSTDPKS